jgi:hypothetical protein
MPAILPDETYDLWLDPGFQKTDDVCHLLKPFNAALMRRYEVSSRVNLVKKDDAGNESKSSCTRPILTRTGTFNAGITKYTTKGTEIDSLFAAGAERPAHSFIEGARRPVSVNVAFTACQFHFYDPQIQKLVSAAFRPCPWLPNSSCWYLIYAQQLKS